MCVFSGTTVTTVVRDCNNSIPLEAADRARVTNRCVHGTFVFPYQTFTLQGNSTVCPCFTSLCNAGNITFGQTLGPQSPPTTLTWIQSSSPRVPHTGPQTVRTSPVVNRSTMTTRRRGDAGAHKDSSATPTSNRPGSIRPSPKNSATTTQSTSTTTEMHTGSGGLDPVDVVAIILSVIVVIVLVVIAIVVCYKSKRCRRALIV